MRKILVIATLVIVGGLTIETWQSVNAAEMLKPNQNARQTLTSQMPINHVRHDRMHHSPTLVEYLPPIGPIGIFAAALNGGMKKKEAEPSVAIRNVPEAADRFRVLNNPGDEMHNPYGSEEMSQGDELVYDLRGEWLGKGYNCPDENGVPVRLDELVSIAQTGRQVIATKITGDDCVGAGETTWKGEIYGNKIRGEMFGTTRLSTTPISFPAELLIVNDRLIELHSAGLTFHRQVRENKESQLTAAPLTESTVATPAEPTRPISGHKLKVLHTAINPSNNHTYHLLEQSTWTDASAKAEKQGGHLVTVRNQSENDWIFNTFSNWGGRSRDLWLGYNDSLTEGAFVWSNGEEASYSNWSALNPDNNTDTESSGEDYVHMYGHGSQYGPGKWNDMFDARSADWSPGYYGVAEVPTK